MSTLRKMDYGKRGFAIWFGGGSATIYSLCNLTEMLVTCVVTVWAFQRPSMTADTLEVRRCGSS